MDTHHSGNDQAACMEWLANCSMCIVYCRQLSFDPVGNGLSGHRHMQSDITGVADEVGMAVVVGVSVH